MAWFVTACAFVVALVLLGMLLPSPGGRPRWRLWLAARADRLAAALRGDRADSGPDPFVALRLQTRLGVLAAQIQALEEDDHVYAKAHRLVAARAAYDDLLDEACALAGVPVDRGRRGEARRAEEELALAARGWSW